MSKLNLEFKNVKILIVYSLSITLSLAIADFVKLVFNYLYPTDKGKIFPTIIYIFFIIFLLFLMSYFS
jgi:hypothetical protein